MHSALAKLLIIKPSALGDIVHSLPFLAAVKERFPESEVHWVVAKGLHTFLEGHPLIHRLWVIDKESWKKFANLQKTVHDISGLWKGLRREKFDVSVDLSGLLRSGLITFAANARRKVGFVESDEGSPYFYTDKIQGDMGIHAVDRYLKIAEFLGCNTSSVRFPFPPYNHDPLICRDLPQEYIVLAPSAGKEANRWPADRFGELAARFSLPSVVIASAGEAAIAEEAVRHSRGKAVSVAGRTNLKELCAVIEKAKFFVTNDTGPMHIAAALNVPVFALFGPANPIRTGPYGDIHTVIREDVECAPCYRWKPCDNWRCMENLSVDKVYGVIRQKIGGNP